MANEDRFLQDDSGQVYFKPPGAKSNADLVPVNQRQIEQITQGALSTLAAQAGDSLASPVSGALVLGERAYNAVTGEDSHRFADTQAFMDANRQTRAMGSPVATLAGDIAGGVPDAALAAVTGGATAGARLGVRVGTEFAAQGVMGALRNPNDPLAGAIMQGGLGGAIPLSGAALRGVAAAPMTRNFVATMENVVTRNRARMPAAAAVDPYVGVGYRPGARAEAPGPRSLSAAQMTGSRALEGERVFGKGFLSGDEMGPGPTGEGLDFPMSQAQMELIDAPDMVTFNAAREADNVARERAAKNSLVEAGKEKLGFADKRIDYDKLRRAQQEHVVKRTAAELGIRDSERMTPDAVGARMTEIGDEIDDLLARKPHVDMRGLAEDVKAYLEREHATTKTRDLMEKYSKQIGDKMEAKSGVANPGGAKSRDILQIRNRINDSIKAAAKNESDTELVDGLTHLKKQLDRRLMKNWDSEMHEDYNKLGRQWDIAKALFKGTDAMTPRGDVELGKLVNAFRASDHLRKTGRSGEDPFLQYLQTAQAIMATEFKDSGTPRGVADLLKSKVADAALGMVPGGSLLRGG